ncbi:MAG TPA: ABC transporter ATP-binding protein, partial [Vicinamibacterales bacterium]
RMRKVGKTERVNRTEEVLNLLKISELAERRPFQLSGGQQQRVALARSLVFQPRILLMDEPLGALDARLRTQMQLELRSLQKRTGVTTVFVTHDQEEAMIMSDRVVIMRDGMIVEEGDPEKLYREPHNRFAAEFLGTTNLIPVTSLREDGDRLIAQLEGIPGPVEVTGNGLRTGDAVSIRPECIDCSAAGSGSGSLRGVVRDRGFRGSHAILLVQVGKRTLLVRQDSRHRLDIGSEVDIAWQAADARLVRGD